jgi:hypothetical protein
MGTARRLVSDESGMTLALAMMMIVLIGVMGAGLLTFVSKDLNTVIEENRGQRALELGDAGVGAAKRQLTSDCGSNADCAKHYDSVTTDVADLQWSTMNSGLTLNDLDGVGGTPDSVNVKIATAPGTFAFTVTSTGFYGNAKRKIEAKLNGVTGVGGGGGGNITFAAGYSPSDILITGNNVKIKGMSLFSESNIIIDGLTTSGVPGDKPGDPPDTSPWAQFKKEYEGTLVKNGPDIFDTQQSQDELGDWDSRKFTQGQGDYNTTPRGDQKFPADTSKTFNRVGFAAQNYICGTTTPTSHFPKCAQDSDSIADGWYGYDKTTGSKGQRVPFVDKQPVNGSYLPNDPANTITYPFPREPRPDPANLKQSAISTNSFVKLDPGQQTDPAFWNTWIPNGSNNRVLFIDARNQDITYNRNDKNTQYKGVIVVWCGNLTMQNSNFSGVILTFWDQESSLPTAPSETDPPTTCTSTSPGGGQGKFTAINSDLTAWIYTLGGTPGITPGLTIGDSTSLAFVPSAETDLLGLVLNNPVPTSFAVQGWREVYN